LAIDHDASISLHKATFQDRSGHGTPGRGRRREPGVKEVGVLKRRFCVILRAEPPI